ncbi:MAG: AAA family ATPase [Anaerolineae bacterium]
MLLAAELYRGDFLAGYYDDWILIERERLRELFLSALEGLVGGLKARGDYERALIFARRLAGEDPWREEAHREVMRLCHLLGRDGEALKQFEVCRQALRDEFDAEPEPETIALAGEIAQRLPPGTAPYLPSAPLRLLGSEAGPLELPLVGRADERAALLAHLEAAIHGMGGLALVEGEAGVGKTRLLQELARDAQWRDAQVLWGQGRETADQSPFGPWAEALNSALSPLRLEQWSQLVAPIWLQVLCPLLPALAAFAPEPALEPERERLVNAFTQLLIACSRAAPLLVILEDLHWADEDSLEMLAALGRRLAAHAVLIVASYRDDEARVRLAAWERLQALRRAGQHEWLRLEPLGAEASGELIRRSLGTGQDAPLFETRLYQETGGNPLFILESLRSLYDEGLLFQDAEGRWGTPWDETTATYADLPLPPAVEQAIARRLAQLAPAERAVLDMAAVLGSGFELRLLQAACDQGAERLLPAIYTLVRRHFLVEQQDTTVIAPDLQIAKAAAPNPAVAGAPLTYTLTYTNAGSAVALDVYITDTLPASVTFGGVITQPHGLSGPTLQGQTLVWYAPALVDGTGGDIVLLVTVDAGATGVITNQAVIANQIPESDLMNNTAIETTTVGHAAVMIGPAASGVLTYTDGQGNTTTAAVPAGAVTATTTLLYTALPTTAALPSGLVFAGHAFTLEAYRHGVHLPGLAFGQPIITIHYSEADVAGLDENALALHYWDGSRWADAATTCTPPSAYNRHPDQNWLAVPVCHLSEFGLFGGTGHRLYLPLVVRNY